MIDESGFDKIKVTLTLGDLTTLHSEANVSEYRADRLDHYEKQIAELGNANDGLRRKTDGQENEIRELRDALNTANAQIERWKEAEQTTAAAKEAADFAKLHDTPFEDSDVEEACRLIRALLAERKGEVR